MTIEGGGAELDHHNLTTVRLRGVEDLFRCQWGFVALLEIVGGVNDMFGDIAGEASMTEVCVVTDLLGVSNCSTFGTCEKINQFNNILEGPIVTIRDWSAQTPCFGTYVDTNCLFTYIFIYIPFIYI